MPKPKKLSQAPRKDSFADKSGYDVMAGPKIRTRKSDVRPIFIPQRRLNVGMDVWPT